MKTVKEVSQLTGLSVRTLHEIGLLPPTMVGENGYRFYDAAALRRLQDILLFRELAFPLKTIKQLLDSPSYDQQAALAAQIKMLELRKAHLEKVIAHARTLQKGEETMTFDIYSKSQLEAFQLEAKERWGETEAYMAYEAKVNQPSAEQLIKDMGEIFSIFGRMLDQPVAELAVQQQVKLCRITLVNTFTIAQLRSYQLLVVCILRMTALEQLLIIWVVQERQPLSAELLAIIVSTKLLSAYHWLLFLIYEPF